MAEIKAADVAKLRKATGAGMMDCKKALTEAGGDFDKAIEELRKKGQKLASKRADRETSEGTVLGASNDANTFAALVSLNCETDFVAKNDDFTGTVQKILDMAIEKQPKDKDELLSYEIDGVKLSDKIVDMVGKIGEKIELGAYECIEAPYVVSYIHPGNQLVSLVGLNKVPADEQVAKDVAMQVAAMAPVSIDKDDVPQDIIDKELEIGREQARQEGKKEELLDRIAQGKLGRFFKDNTLLNQDFIKDSKQSVKDYLKSQDKDLTVTAMKRYSVSE